MAYYFSKYFFLPLMRNIVTRIYATNRIKLKLPERSLQCSIKLVKATNKSTSRTSKQNQRTKRLTRRKKYLRIVGRRASCNYDQLYPSFN